MIVRLVFLKQRGRQGKPIAGQEHRCSRPSQEILCEGISTAGRCDLPVNDHGAFSASRKALVSLDRPNNAREDERSKTGGRRLISFLSNPAGLRSIAGPTGKHETTNPPHREVSEAGFKRGIASLEYRTAHLEADDYVR